MTTAGDRLVNDYLRELREELADVPPAIRREVLDEITEHIAEARSELESDDEVGVRNLLERLGDPAAIADEARERFDVRRRPPGWREIGALVLLPIGGLILPFFGWFVGLVLLWASDAWSTRQKLLGTLVIPGGLLLPLGMMVFATGSAETCYGTGSAVNGQPVRETCTGGASGIEHALWISLFAVLVIAPVAVVIVLARRMRRPAAAVA